VVIEGGGDSALAGRRRRPSKLNEQFLKVALQCDSVICCRVLPSQKADVTKTVREDTDMVTLAIGDGNNDVAMIKQAHIGVGLSGEEGMQAVMSADYAIAQFRFLENLVLHHGFWSYARIAKLVNYFFYKNVTYTLSMFWYQVYTGWAVQRIFDDALPMCYNLVFTAFPVFVFGIFDKDLEAKSIVNEPQVYERGPKKTLFTLRRFAGWVCYGISQSFVMSLMTSNLMLSGDIVNGQMVGIWSTGNMIFSVIVVTVNVTLALQMRYWTYLAHLTTWGSIALWFSFIMVYNMAPINSISKFPLFKSADTVYYSFTVMMEAPEMWLVMTIVCTVCLCPTICYKYYIEVLDPAPELVMREAEVSGLGLPRHSGGDDEVNLSIVADSRGKPNLEKRKTLIWDREHGTGDLQAADFSTSQFTPPPAQADISGKWAPQLRKDPSDNRSLAVT
jgi:magnesium-transporting ATPase (P-type)